jgi:hypothetical protein
MSPRIEAAPRGRQGGHSLVELVLSLGLAASLAAMAGLGPPGGGLALTAVQGELRAAVEQAFRLARARDRPVRLALGPGAGATGELPPLVLPRGVRWGLPGPAVPLPPGLAPPVRAHQAGVAHDAITVTPGGTAEANVWFLTDGRDAVCLRLSGGGALTLLRWRRRTGRWDAL